MTSDLNTGEAVEAYLERAATGDGRAGTRMALELLDSALPGEVIDGLLGAAQREVGERWSRGEWTIADEHLASGVTQKALDAVANSIEPPVPGGLVVVTCAEGDWHSLPAQMFAEMLGLCGFTVAFLGASTPVDHVAALIARRRPEAVAVSCTLPLFFSGVSRLADVAHSQGIPLLAGGGAFGTGPERATRLGADAWAAGADDAAEVLRGWQHRTLPTLPGPVQLASPLLQLHASADEIAAAAFKSLAAAYPQVASYTDQQLARTREDLAYITQYIAAARLVGDPTVLTDMLDWLRTRLARRGIPPVVVDAGLTALSPLISRTDPQGGQLALDARQALTAGQGPGQRS